MGILLTMLEKKIPQYRDEVKKLLAASGEKVVSSVTIDQVYGGLRGVTSLICDTSYVNPECGLLIRETPVMQLKDRLPEELFFLLCTGELPNAEALADLQEELKARSEVPGYAWDVLAAMPEDSHPMTMLSSLLLTLQRNSVFGRRYNQLTKQEYWRAVFEDSLQIIAKLPTIAAAIYRAKIREKRILYDPKLDMGANYARMLGIPDPNGNFAKLMRLYLTLHCDHDAGNVSAFTASTVASSLSDPYYAVSAGYNGLAGPLHGLANQETLRFLLEMRDAIGNHPTKEQVEKFVRDLLASGKVVPGYGHAVLRTADPRFVAFLEFGKTACPEDPLFSMAEKLYSIVPGILQALGKVKNPWPNVDAISGTLLYHFGLTMQEYYTVPFAVSRAMGICAQMILNRGLMLPIMRPKSVSTESLKKEAGKK